MNSDMFYTNVIICEHPFCHWRCWANPRGYIRWPNALGVPGLQEFVRMSPKSTQLMSWLLQSHSWTTLGMSAINKLLYHPSYLLMIFTKLLFYSIWGTDLLHQEGEGAIVYYSSKHLRVMIHSYWLVNILTKQSDAWAEIFYVWTSA